MVVNASYVEVERAHDGDVYLGKKGMRCESRAQNMIPLHLYGDPLKVYFYVGRVWWMMKVS